MLAARWLRVAPWELMAQDSPDFWTEAAVLLSNSEHASIMKKTEPTGGS